MTSGASGGGWLHTRPTTDDDDSQQFSMSTVGDDDDASSTVASVSELRARFERSNSPALQDPRRRSHSRNRSPRRRQRRSADGRSLRDLLRSEFPDANKTEVREAMSHAKRAVTAAAAADRPRQRSSSAMDEEDEEIEEARQWLGRLLHGEAEWMRRQLKHNRHQRLSPKTTSGSPLRTTTRPRERRPKTPVGRRMMSPREEEDAQELASKRYRDEMKQQQRTSKSNSSRRDSSGRRQRPRSMSPVSPRGPGSPLQPRQLSPEGKQQRYDKLEQEIEAEVQAATAEIEAVSQSTSQAVSQPASHCTMPVCN
eukprot:COSAG05_NODE_2120_length_3535_cov_1.493597_4_plen_311_part_00